MRDAHVMLMFSILALSAGAALNAGEAVMIFAAASVEPALEDIIHDWHASDGTAALGNYAASSQLARQIAQGAHADLFLSADERWMDDLAQRTLIDAASRIDLLGNHLVLIAAKDHAFTVKASQDFDLASAFTGRLATTDASVPLGRYARESFQALGWLKALEPRLLPLENARAVVHAVELGEIACGVAYSSDAVSSDAVSSDARSGDPARNAKLRIICEIPDRLHTPIRYPLALLHGAQPAARQLRDLLCSKAAADIFIHHGFQVRPGGR